MVLTNSARFTSREARPAGVYYSHVGEAAPLRPQGEETPGLQLSGISEPDHEAVRLADGQAQGRSPLIAASSYAEGGTVSTGLRPGQLDELRERVVELLKDTAAAMLEGLVNVSPLSEGNRDACAYCDFVSVCGFDRDCARPRRRSDGLPRGRVNNAAIPAKPGQGGESV